MTVRMTRSRRLPRVMLLLRQLESREPIKNVLEAVSGSSRPHSRKKLGILLDSVGAKIPLI